MKFAIVRRAALAAALLLSLCAHQAVAGVLDGNAFAFVSGSTTFSDGGDLTGYVDYAVFLPGDFQLAGFTGYTPTVGEVVYAYQVFVTGTHPVSHFGVELDNPADNIGDFLLGGTAPDSANIGGLSADWSFVPTEVTAFSEGLVFSSPYLPIFLAGSVVNGGSSADVDPLPSPGGELVPEPSAVVLAVLAAGGLAVISCVVRRRHTAGVACDIRC